MDGDDAPLQQTAATVFVESGKETPSQPKSFDDLRGENRGSFDQSEEEIDLEKELEGALEPGKEVPEETGEVEEEPAPEEKPDGKKVESGKPKEQNHETHPEEEKPEGKTDEKPTDTQTKDGYVAEVKLVVDGVEKAVPVEELYNDVEMDLYTPTGTHTVKGLEPLRVLAQKGLYSDEKNQKSNQMMDEAKNLTANFQREVTKQAQQVAARYLQDWMEKNLTGQAIDPNNPLATAQQDPNQPANLRDQYLLTQIQTLRQQQADFVKQQEEERARYQAQMSEQKRQEAGNNIAKTIILPFREKYKVTGGTYDDDAFSSFADVAANRTVFRVTQINQERKAQDSDYTGMSQEEVTTITAQVAREVFSQEQKRLERLMEQRLKSMKRPVRVGPIKGSGAVIENGETPNKQKGPRTFESLRQARPAAR